MYTEKDNKTVNILGTDYEIKFVPEEELDEIGADAATDWSAKLIRIKVFVPSKYDMKDLEMFQRKLIRHEIIHAFLYESGLAECSGNTGAWAKCEAAVDFFAYQHNKIHAAFERAGAL